MSGNQVTGFTETPRRRWANKWRLFYFVTCAGPHSRDQTSWECEPLAQLAAKGELMAFEHTGFWQPMDTLREEFASRTMGQW